MNNQIEEWVNDWANNEGDSKFRDINKQINYLADNLFSDYKYYIGPSPDFFIRLEHWLRNVDAESDRKTLFELVPNLFYIGEAEFDNLYRVAYNEIFQKWIIDIEGIQFDDIDMAERLIQSALEKCWVCPITDSLDINSFIRVTNSPRTYDWYPQWFKIHERVNSFVDYKDYINGNGIKRLILIEDFVSSGSQIARDIDFIANKNLDLDILVVPLINCPKGISKFKILSSKYPRLTISSVVELSEKSLILKNPSSIESELFGRIRELIKRTYLKVTNGIDSDSGIEPYSPFGFKETGGLVVMFSNTPDNSLPIIYWESKSWNPLFKRHSRII